MKMLVVFFSYSGNTRLIANKIKDELGCDILEIKPFVPYSNDYQKVVNDEQNSESSNHLPEIENIDVNIDIYDAIILGTPVWWYRPAPVIRTFLSRYNLKGKTIIPFATNGGWVGRTFNEIKSICFESIVKDEINIEFDGNNLKTDIEKINEWIINLKKDLNINENW